VTLSCTPFFIFLSILGNQVPQHRQANPVVSWHSGATQIMLEIHLTSFLGFPCFLSKD
jgi:hypothetical protein